MKVKFITNLWFCSDSSVMLVLLMMAQVPGDYLQLLFNKMDSVVFCH